MLSEQEIQIATAAIISFVNSNTLIKEGKQYEQSEPESTSSFTEITSSVQSVISQIQNNSTPKQIINIPKFLHSLSMLTSYKLNNDFNQQFYQQKQAVIHCSRLCLWNIYAWGDEQDQMELVNIRYAGIQVIAFSIASGQGEEQDEQIWNGLNRISWFFCCLYEGRNNRESSFPRQPILAKRSQEQIEEEGGSEEIETLLINKGNQNYNIKGNAKWAKRSILNHFIHKRQL